MLHRISNKTIVKGTDVIILSGGLGTRLREVVSDRPKPMAEINGHPFLDILLKYIAGFGFRRFILCAGHLSDNIREYYKNQKINYNIIFSHEHSQLGTGGAIKNAESLILNSPFLVMNGDSFCPIDLLQFIDFHLRKEALSSMVVVEAQNVGDCGMITLDNFYKVIQFEEKKRIDKRAYINAGIYLFEKDVLSIIPPDTKYSLEYDLFPRLVGSKFFGFITKEKFIDIGTPERLEYARSFFPK